MLSIKEVCKGVYGIESPFEYFALVKADAARPYPPSKKRVQMEFPYRAPVLPVPLPTVNDIKQAGQMGHIVSDPSSLRYVFRLSAKYIVKFSPSPEILQVCLISAG
jgi:hypothetical protein